MSYPQPSSAGYTVQKALFGSMEVSPLNVIIPIGGNGTRFGRQGYRYPKPLINIVGRPMLLWIIDHLSLRPCDTLWVAINKEIDDNFQVAQLLTKSFADLDIQVLKLLHQTQGAAETLYIATQSMQAKHLKRRTISIDCDTIYWIDVLELVRNLPATHGACVYFEDNGDRPIYSYIKTKDEDGLEKIIDIREKAAISNKANTGAYIFPSAELLKAQAAKYLDTARQPSHVGEYFSSRLVELMLSKGISFVGIPIGAADFSIVGTPDQLKSFLATIKSSNFPLPGRGRKGRFCFDLDMTLVGAPAVAGDYSTCPPIKANIKLAQQLYDAGHHIIIQTARRMRTHNGNVGAVIADIGSKTLAQLDQYNIPFHDIHFGKPHADVYIDDLAVNANVDTIQEVGWLLDDLQDPKPDEHCKRDMVDARDFNSIQIINDRVVKSSKRDSILGEMYFYSHMPQGIACHFPRVHSVDYIIETGTFTIEMECCAGYTFSHLLAGRSITKGRLEMFLAALHDIHAADYLSAETLNIPPSLRSVFDKNLLASYTSQGAHGSTNSTPDIYANYRQKLDQRYKDYADCYHDLGPLAQTLFVRVKAFLDTYEAEKMATPARVIHGDPVFSNAIFSPDDQTPVRFIDVRCRLGDTLTTAGDIYYDLAKVLQSLCGYDHVLLGQTDSGIGDSTANGGEAVLRDADAALLADLRSHFFDFIQKMYPNHVHRKILYGLTASLFFTLIPLHGPELRPLFLRLCEETMHKATDGTD